MAPSRYVSPAHPAARRPLRAAPRRWLAGPAAGALLAAACAATFPAWAAAAAAAEAGPAGRGGPVAAASPAASAGAPQGGSASQGSGAGQAAAPGAERRPYRIAPGPLDEALAGFAAAAGVGITVPPELVRGRSAPGLQGDYTVGEGFARLLDGSGLQAAGGEAGVYVLRRLPAPLTTFSPVTVTASNGRDATSEGTGSYAARAATIGKMAQSLREIPQSVTVVTRQRIEDQNLDTLDRALAQTTGITVHAMNAHESSVSSRGFDIDTLQYDGVATIKRDAINGSPLVTPDLALFDRVEVLRGPAGLLQGAGQPGAAVNLVRKRPTDEFHAYGTATLGSWNTRRAEADLTGPLNPQRTLRGRLIAVHDERDSYIDEVDSRKELASGMLEFDLTPRTVLGLGGTVQNLESTPYYIGMPFLSDGRPAGLPRSTYLGASWNHAVQKERSGFLSLEHRFDSEWRVKLTGNYTEGDGRNKYAYALAPSGIDPADPSVYFNGFANETEVRQANFDVYATGPFALFGRRHEVVLGASANQDTYDTTWGDMLWPWNTVSGDPYHWDPDSIPEPPGTSAATTGRTVTRQHGAYATLRLSLADPLTLILGARVSTWKARNSLRNNATGVRTGTGRYQVNDEITPYGGIVLDLGEHYSAYASYTSIFQPQNATDRSGQLLDPVIGSNYELGVKGEFYDGALNASAAVFRIDQKNRAQSDFDGPSPCPYTGSLYCSVAAGKVRSQGFEAEVSGNLTANWQLYAGYTYNTTKYERDPTNEGRVFNTLTPRHLLRLWTQYRLPGALQRWSVGAGVNLQSSFYSDNGTVRLEQGGYALASLRVGYDLSRRVSLALNVDNLFDRTYWSKLDGVATNNYYGPSRSAMLTVRARY